MLYILYVLFIIRRIFERVITMTLPPKKMKFFFKRYLDFEKQHGTLTTVNHVKQKVSEYVKNCDLQLELDD